MVCAAKLSIKTFSGSTIFYSKESIRLSCDAKDTDYHSEGGKYNNAGSLYLLLHGHVKVLPFLREVCARGR